MVRFFSGSKGEEIELEKADITTAVPQIPDIRLSASSDITDHGLRSSTRALETDAAATKAHSKAQRLHVSQNDTTDDDSDTEVTEPVKPEDESKREARRLVRTYTQAHPEILRIQHRSGTQTPALDKHLHDLEYVPPPDKYKANPATLARSLTRLLQQGYKPRTYMDDPENPITHHGDSEDHSPGYFSPRRLRSGRQSRRNSGDFSTPVSGTRTPKRPKWYDRDDPDYQSLDSTSALLHGVSSTLAAAGLPPSHARPKHARTKSSQSMIAQAVDLIKHPGKHMQSRTSRRGSRIDEEQVLREISEIIDCRKYLKKLARSLMLVGAPTHRLEEYMKTSARALHIDADFMYMPGSMIVSINDSTSFTTEVTLVRESGGVDLGKFKDVFRIYKLVMHRKITPKEGMEDLEAIHKQPGRHHLALRILAFGLAACFVGPFAFSARPVDFAPCFLLGCFLGFLQLVVSPRSEQFSHVFEVLASVIISFTARGLGSIYHNGEPVFCFSAIAQSSIALILPGYTVLCAALELQSRSLVSGSVRMVYAIIYSLFLGFGILVGSVLLGLMYPQAQTSVTCDVPYWWDDSRIPARHIYVRFIWVPLFAICLAIINQAKWIQIPVMTLIACCGYQANFWISTKLGHNIQVSNAIGAFVIGTMANLYSRWLHGLAAAAMLPAIFVMVPSGLAASGSLVAGITSAQQITGNITGVSIINNGTAGFLDAQQNSTTNSNNVYGGTIFNVGYGMVQVAIGISVGLYLSALVVYPFGKRRSVLASF